MFLKNISRNVHAAYVQCALLSRSIGFINDHKLFFEAKQGKPGMPYGIEATEFTKQLVNGKDVKVKLLRKDQYGRVIGVLTVHPTACINIVTTKTTCPDEDLSLELAKNGLAFLYTGKGSEYDGHKIQFKDNIASAKKEKKGVWENGVENVLLPSDYKRQCQRRFH